MCTKQCAGGVRKLPLHFFLSGLSGPLNLQAQLKGVPLSISPTALAQAGFGRNGHTVHTSTSVMTSYDALNICAEYSFKVRSLCGWSSNTTCMEGWDKRWVYGGVFVHIHIPIQHVPVSMLAGVLGTVGQVQERLVRAPKVQKPHGENERAVQNPLI
jgi:hypothetical protein